MQKILTISVAAYNVENTLDELMASLIRSGCMDQLEILIVDDGSKDRTAEKAGEYEKAWPDSVRLISKKNGGHGSTINRGIEEAAGKFFRPLDGDDWMDSENLPAFLSMLNQTEADWVISDFRTCYADGTQKIDSFPLPPERPLSLEETLPNVNWICYHALTIRTELLKKESIRLDEHCFYVDNEYCLFFVPGAKTAAYFPNPVYCYRMGETGQSVSDKSRMAHIGDDARVVNRLLDFCGELPGNLFREKKDYIVHGTARHCVWYIYSLLLFPASREKQKEIRDFDLMIREKNVEVYRHMNGLVKMVPWLRKSGYRAYRLIRIYRKAKGYC